MFNKKPKYYEHSIDKPKLRIKNYPEKIVLCFPGAEKAISKGETRTTTKFYDDKFDERELIISIDPKTITFDLSPYYYVKGPLMCDGDPVDGWELALDVVLPDPDVDEAVVRLQGGHLNQEIILFVIKQNGDIERVDASKAQKRV